MASQYPVNLFLAYIKFYAATSNTVLVNQKQEILKTLLSRTFIVSRFKVCNFVFKYVIYQNMFSICTFWPVYLWIGMPNMGNKTFHNVLKKLYFRKNLDKAMFDELHGRVLLVAYLAAWALRWWPSLWWSTRVSDTPGVPPRTRPVQPGGTLQWWVASPGGGLGWWGQIVALLASCQRRRSHPTSL